MLHIHAIAVWSPGAVEQALGRERSGCASRESSTWPNALRAHTSLRRHRQGVAPFHWLRILRWDGETCTGSLPAYRQRSGSSTATNRLLSGSATRPYPNLAVSIAKKLHSLSGLGNVKECLPRQPFTLLHSHFQLKTTFVFFITRKERTPGYAWVIFLMFLPAIIQV